MDTHVDLCRRAHRELFGKGDLDLADALVTPDFLDHEAPPSDARGPEVARSTVRWLHSGLDDLEYDVVDAFGSGDRVVTRVRMSATHARDWLGMPPTNRRFTVQQIHIFRIADGKIAEHWANRDDLGMMRQLGAVGG